MQLLADPKSSFLVRQSRSAFIASSLQDLPAIGAGHSLAEAVNFLSMQFLGLICPFHLIPSFFQTQSVGLCRNLHPFGSGSAEKAVKLAETFKIIV